MTDEQMIAEITLAIARSEYDGEISPHDAAVAAHSVIAGKVAEHGWQPIETAPHAMHVLAARFDEVFGEWVYGVVLSPPSHPFTHWQQLPEPPAALAPYPDTSGAPVL